MSADIEGVDLAALRAHLKERLPEPFIPTAWAVLPALPLSPNGKVDRKALARIEPKGLGEAGASAAAALSPLTGAVAGLFAEALGAAAVGPHEDFFRLGGHSLLAARVLGRVSRLFGVDLPVSALFQATTAAALSAQISRVTGEASAAAPVVPVLRQHEEQADGLPLTFAQQRL